MAIVLFVCALLVCSDAISSWRNCESTNNEEKVFNVEIIDFDNTGDRNRSVSELLDKMSEIAEQMSPEIKLIEFFNSTEYFNDYNPLNARKRITLYSSAFAWLFKDLHNIVFHYDNADNVYKQTINEHCDEDGSHWKMLQYDYKQLNLDDSKAKTSEAYEFLFGDITAASRNALYQIMWLDGRLNGKNNELARFILMESIERVGHVVFGAISEDYKYFYEKTGVDLLYFGGDHADLEPGTLHTNHDENNSISLSPEELFGSIEITEKQFNFYADLSRYIMYDLMLPHDYAKYEFVTQKWKTQTYFDHL